MWCTMDYIHNHLPEVWYYTSGTTKLKKNVYNLVFYWLVLLVNVNLFKKIKDQGKN